MLLKMLAHLLNCKVRKLRRRYHCITPTSTAFRRPGNTGFSVTSLCPKTFILSAAFSEFPYPSNRSTKRFENLPLV
jgi:hypothetical protein